MADGVYPLNPRPQPIENIGIELKEYRTKVVDKLKRQARSGELRQEYLAALAWYGNNVGFDNSHVRVKIAIDKRWMKVTTDHVVWKENHTTNNRWVKKIIDYKEKWNTGLRQEEREKQWAKRRHHLGIIVFEFTVNCPDGGFQFDVQMGLPVLSTELNQKRDHFQRWLQSRADWRDWSSPRWWAPRMSHLLLYTPRLPAPQSILNTPDPRRPGHNMIPQIPHHPSTSELTYIVENPHRGDEGGSAVAWISYPHTRHASSQSTQAQPSARPHHGTQGSSRSELTYVTDNTLSTQTLLATPPRPRNPIPPGSSTGSNNTTPRPAGRNLDPRR